MVAVFVGENVIAGKIPASAQLPFQRVVEARIDIDCLVCRAIERADCRRCISAPFRADAAAAEQVERRLLETVSLITEGLGPRCVERCQGITRLGRIVAAGAYFLRIRIGRPRLLLALLDALDHSCSLHRIQAENEIAQRRDDNSAATDTARLAAGHASAARSDIDIAGIERIEPHPFPLCCRLYSAHYVRDGLNRYSL